MKSTIKTFRFGISLFVLAFLSSTLEAQLIGNRVPGPPGAQQRNGASSVTPGAPGASGINTPAPGGVIQPTSRFVRGNRKREDFVGSNRTEIDGFVGAGQALAVGRVPTAAETFRLETKASLRTNRPLPSLPASGMYYPRLDLATLSDDAPEAVATTTLAPEMLERIERLSAGKVDAFVRGRVVLLRGQVESKRVSEIIQTMIEFEPGIDRVLNELQAP